MKNKQIIIYIFATIIVSLISFKIGNKLGEKKIIKTNTVRTVLPVKIVSDYALQSISADINGIITNVNKDSIVFKTESGTSIIAYNEPQGVTTLVDAQSSAPIKFSDLKVGEKISGGISVVISPEVAFGFTGQRKTGDVILHYIKIIQ